MPGMAKMAEIGEVLPHLGVGKAKQLAQLAGADGGPPLADQMLQLAQIQAQPADDHGRDVARRRCAAFVLDERTLSLIRRSVA